MKYRIFWGIDPGGGIAQITHTGIRSWPMPKTTAGVVELIDWIVPAERSTLHVTVEEVRLFTLKGLTQCPKCHQAMQIPKLNAGMGNFLKRAGATLGILATLGIKYEEVPPITWQSAFQLVAKRGQRVSQTEKKKRHKARAAKIWPEHAGNITLAVVDAMLLAEFGRMAHR